MRSDTPERKDRLLALEIRSRWTGFVGIEAAARLTEWGRRKHKVKGSKFADLVKRRIDAILDLWLPARIVVRTRPIRSPKARRRISTIVSVVRREARKNSIEFRAISAKDVRQFFAARQCKSKYQIATLIARQFPELSWRLPPKRKSWKAEDHRMVIFDAAATALAFLNKSPPEN
jgi:lipase chaperone LimK